MDPDSESGLLDLRPLGLPLRLREALGGVCVLEAALEGPIGVANNGVELRSWLPC